MIHIRKKDEPPAFKEWKLQNEGALFSDMPAQVKADLQKALLKEQGYICCFCGTKIGVVATNGAVTPVTPGERPHFLACRVAHIKPQSTHKDKALDYYNLCCSCPSQEETPALERSHCDRFQGNKELKISPLDRSCEKNFKYSLAGAIAPSESAAASEPASESDAAKTIKALNLNATRLRTRRLEAINGVMELLNEEISLDLLGDKFSSRDREGRFEEYFFVILSYFDLFNHYYKKYGE